MIVQFICCLNCLLKSKLWRYFWKVYIIIFWLHLCLFKMDSVCISAIKIFLSLSFSLLVSNMHNFFKKPIDFLIHWEIGWHEVFEFESGLNRPWNIIVWVSFKRNIQSMISKSVLFILQKLVIYFTVLLGRQILI